MRPRCGRGVIPGPAGRAVIRDILRGRLAADPDPHGLRLRGARITGRLDLENLTTDVNLELKDCLLEEGVLARDARLAFVGLTGCQLEHPAEPPLDATGLTCSVLDLSRARVIGHTEHRRGQPVRRPHRRQPRLHRGGAAQRLRPRPDRRAACKSARACSCAAGSPPPAAATTARSACSAPTSAATRLHRGGAAQRLRPCPDRGRPAGRPGACSCAAGSPPPVAATTARSTCSAPTSAASSTATGRSCATTPAPPCTPTACRSIRACSSAAGSPPPAAAARRGQPGRRPHRRQPRLRRGEPAQRLRPRPSADGLQVGQDMQCDRLTADGGVVLGGHICRLLSFEGAVLNSRGGVALSSDGLRVDGTMFCRNGFTVTRRGPAPGSADRRPPVLRWCQAQQPRRPGIRRLAADCEPGHVLPQAKVPGTRAAVLVEGAVRLRGAHIGGHLDCDGAELRNDSGPALNADSLQVDQDMLLTGGFTATGGGDGAVRLPAPTSAAASNATGRACATTPAPPCTPTACRSIRACSSRGFTATGSGGDGAVYLSAPTSAATSTAPGRSCATTPAPPWTPDSLQVGQGMYLAAGSPPPAAVKVWRST